MHENWTLGVINNNIYIIRGNRIRFFSLHKTHIECFGKSIDIVNTNILARLFILRWTKHEHASSAYENPKELQQSFKLVRLQT